MSQAKFLALAGDTASARRVIDAVSMDKNFNSTIEFDVKLVEETILNRTGDFSIF